VATKAKVAGKATPESNQTIASRIAYLFMYIRMYYIRSYLAQFIQLTNFQSATFVT